METDSDRETDGGEITGLTQDELYTVVQTAVKDALIDVFGTVFLLGFALLFIGAGTQVILASSTTGVLFGVGLVSLGLVVAAGAFNLVPPFRE
ncbi:MULTISPECIES: hypothetical protein [Natronolimnohabitans]|uniref:hypothetical protein n=1 Tax=Natronolimnohabitans TaxID=2765403 RepID=UPI000A021B18|nr:MULTISPECIES: hypothetical protein [Natronolimnohabitans]MDQ2051657.1 hypothetical protein [Natronolimnohabitans sp. A-GB9]